MTGACRSRPRQQGAEKTTSWGIDCRYAAACVASSSLESWAKIMSVLLICLPADRYKRCRLFAALDLSMRFASLHVMVSTVDNPWHTLTSLVVVSSLFCRWMHSSCQFTCSCMTACALALMCQPLGATASVFGAFAGFEVATFPAK